MDYEKKIKNALNDKSVPFEVQAWLEEQFSELKESEENQIKKDLIEWSDEFPDTIWRGHYKKDVIAWLEKQGEQNLIVANPPQLGDQKPTDKIESKFKVGDWVVTDKNNVVQIKAIEDSRYLLENAMKFSVCYVDKCWRKWTIHDAKDGDVLFHSDSASNGIFIFKEIIDKGFAKEVICYCDYDSEDHFCLGEHHTCCWTDAKILYPATKEQRDFLFQKMKEAGYTFDFKNKELKKIKNDIEIPFGAKDSELQEATYYIPKGFHAEVDDDKVVIKKGEKHTAWSEENRKRIQRISDFIWKNRKGDTDDIYQQEQDVKWLKSLKDRVGCEANCTTTKEWSEEDEHRVNDTIYFLDTAKKHYASTVELDACIDWLKSLKQRIGE